MDFYNDLVEAFDPQTARNVEALYTALALPLPESHDEYICSSEGMIVFLTQFGIVMRIEAKDESLSAEFGADWQRINHHPLVLQPLGSVDCGKALVEICPGTHVGLNVEEVQELSARLKQDGINYYDAYGPNSGYLLSDNGEKTPLVIDRLGVSILSEQVTNTAALLSKHGRAQEKFLPLKEAFSHAINQPTMKSKMRSMQYFWTLCQQFRDNGDLICGWDTAKTDQDTGIEHKSLAARMAARAYQQRF